MMTRKGIPVPADLAKVLEGDPEAQQAFEVLRPSCQRDYAARIERAKTPEVRENQVSRVVALALEWKRRHPNAGMRMRLQEVSLP